MQSKTWNIKWKYIVEIYPSAFPQKWIFYLFYVLLIFILPVQFINRVKKFGSTAVMKEESHRESAPCSPLMSTARRTLSPCKGHCSPSPSLVFREILFGSLRLGSVFEETYKYKCKGIIWKKTVIARFPAARFDAKKAGLATLVARAPYFAFWQRCSCYCSLAAVPPVAAVVFVAFAIFSHPVRPFFIIISTAARLV